jgi:hypothetical protein
VLGITLEQGRTLGLELAGAHRAAGTSALALSDENVSKPPNSFTLMMFI